MAGEVKRSGFSNPANANLAAAAAPPSATVDFEVHSWGLQTDDPPNELAKIVFKWTAATTRALAISDAATDDVYSTGSLLGVTSGTYGANDTTLTLSTSPAASVAAGDHIAVGIDPTRYTVASVSGSSITILYGLLYPQAIPGVAVRLLTKSAESPSTARMLRVNARTGDAVAIEGTVGFEYHMGWSATAALGEWEDLDQYLVTLSTATMTHYVKDSGQKVTATVVSGARTVAVSGDLRASIIPGVTGVSFGSAPGTLYSVAIVSTASLVLTSAAGVTDSIPSGSGVWIQQRTSFTGYADLDLSQLTATKTLAPAELGGWRLYYAETPISDTLTGATLLETILMNDTRLVLASDGKYYFTWSAPNATWDGSKFYFALVGLDTNVPPNVGDPDTNAWVITYPGQAVILTSSVVGTTMTVTFENITAAGTSNKHLRKVMGGASMGTYSIEGGYDVYRVDYVDLADGSFQSMSTSTGKFLHSDLAVDDVVVVYDSGTGDQWTAICTTAGEVTLNDAALTYSVAGSATPYSGDDCLHESKNLTAKYARVTDRTTQSVLPLDALGQKQYLTDATSTIAVTLTAGADQAVIMESVDTLCDSGKL